VVQANDCTIDHPQSTPSLSLPTPPRALPLVAMPWRWAAVAAAERARVRVARSGPAARSSILAPRRCEQPGTASPLCRGSARQWLRRRRMRLRLPLPLCMVAAVSAGAGRRAWPLCGRFGQLLGLLSGLGAPALPPLLPCFLCYVAN
jgi:hypothetical protein